MKFVLTGKVLSRTVHTVTRTDGTTYDLYQIVIEEPGNYPSQFQLTTKSNSLLGDRSGPFGVGHIVTASGFISSRAKQLKRSDGKPFVKYESYYTVNAIAPAAAAIRQSPDDLSNPTPAPAAPAAPLYNPSEIPDDCPI